MSDPRHFSVIVLGAGNVGSAFVRQLTATHDHLAQRYGVTLRSVALADSSGAIFNAAGLDAATLDQALAAKQQGALLAQQPDALTGLSALELVQHAAEQGITRGIVVDTTAAEGMEPALQFALSTGYGIALANKRPLAGPWEGARAFFVTPRARFEATVGAGLPVINTLRYLVDTGDVVQRIEGALSGTLGYLCSRLEVGAAFSEAVRSAKAKGYTEPDPRDDLSGMDVARKALIMGRLVGWPIELAAIRVDALYPAKMADLGLDEFMAALPALNADFDAYMGALGGVPRYMAEITAEGGTVGLRMVGERVAAQLRGTQNQIAFTTQRYDDIPLSLLGPGAGIEVTAAAVLQDCVQLALSSG